MVVVDLTADGVDVEALGARATTRATLGFYPHVDVEMRRRAEAAGFDMVVPRSRMNREGAALVEARGAADRMSKVAVVTGASSGIGEATAPPARPPTAGSSCWSRGARSGSRSSPVRCATRRTSRST